VSLRFISEKIPTDRYQNNEEEKKKKKKRKKKIERRRRELERKAPEGRGGKKERIKWKNGAADGNSAAISPGN